MKLEKVKKLNPFALDDRLVDYIEKQDLPDKDKKFMITWFPRIMDFILGVGRFFIFFFIFSRAYDHLGDKFYVLVFTFIVTFLFKKTKKVKRENHGN